MKLTLLEVISTRGEVRIDEFKNLVTELCLKVKDGETDVNGNSMQMLYCLDSLGHCEFDFDSRKVFVCKPSLIILPGLGNIRAVLTGARSNELVGKIKDTRKLLADDISLSITKQEKEGLTLPNTIILEAFDESIMRKFSNYIGVPYIGGIPVSWLIANASGSLDEYFLKLKLINNSQINWKMRIFNNENLCFQKAYSAESLPYLVEYTNPTSQQKIYMLYTEQGSAVVDREWGRYYILKKYGINTLYFDEKKHLFAVPVYIPLPRLLARAATLCSGIISNRVKLNQSSNNLSENLNFELFCGVDRSMANLIANKVGQTLNITTIQNNEQEALYD